MDRAWVGFRIFSEACEAFQPSNLSGLGEDVADIASPEAAAVRKDDARGRGRSCSRGSSRPSHSGAAVRQVGIARDEAASIERTQKAGLHHARNRERRGRSAPFVAPTGGRSPRAAKSRPRASASALSPTGVDVAWALTWSICSGVDPGVGQRALHREPQARPLRMGRGDAVAVRSLPPARRDRPRPRAAPDGSPTPPPGRAPRPRRPPRTRRASTSNGREASRGSDCLESARMCANGRRESAFSSSAPTTIGPPGFGRAAGRRSRSRARGWRTRRPRRSRRPSR